ncbi:hypothetical protein [Streptomyces vastus]|uniref:Secreted protein n=1 Tax=Streptomyces vastus TaxID=285451 RepID=A0ABN3Q6K6_9ACTN
MTEIPTSGDGQPEESPAAPEDSATAAPTKKPVRRGRVAAIAGSVLVAAAVVAGTGYTVVTVKDADRDAGAPVWKFPKAKADAGKTAAASGLVGMLVPYDTEVWTRGPDLGEYGSDALLSGEEATALRKKTLRDLPRSQRRQLERQVDKQHIKGIAMRSYLNAESLNHSVDDHAGYTASIELIQMDKGAVKNIAAFQRDFLDILDVFRKGPKIEGHKDAECFLPPRDGRGKLDTMFCSAYEGDVLINATAYGVEPLDTEGVAKLLRAQLDRISEPGEAV